MKRIIGHQKSIFAFCLMLSAVLSNGVVFGQDKQATKKLEEPEFIKLESNFIGDKEQPSVSYFVPWKGVGTPDRLQWQITDKIDRTLDLVDRNVMVRTTTLYQEMNLEMTNTVSK